MTNEAEERAKLARTWEEEFGDHTHCEVCGTDCREKFVAAGAASPVSSPTAKEKFDQLTADFGLKGIEKARAESYFDLGWQCATKEFEESAEAEAVAPVSAEQPTTEPTITWLL